jgi:hypothetical protein
MPPGFESLETLQEAENRAMKQLGEKLRLHLALAVDAFNLISLLLLQVSPAPMNSLPKSWHVAIKLLLRLSNDLRCVELVAARGYPLQACTIAASMCEIAFGIAWVDANEERAQVWLKHDDPKEAPLDVRSMMREGLANLGVSDPEAQTKIEYRVYRQLSMAKHANPLLESRFGLTISGKTVTAMNGPDFSKEAIRATWFALEHAAGYAFIGSSSFFNSHLAARCTPEIADQLATKIESIGAGRKKLESIALAEWGNQDPFPGKW